MKKLSIVILALSFLAYPLMADSLNDVHQAILQRDLDTAKIKADNKQEGLILTTIAYKEYLNLLAESLIVLSQDKSTETICDHIITEFTNSRAIYNQLLAKIDKTKAGSIWQAVLNPPLTLSTDLEVGAKKYSTYLLNITAKKYPSDYFEVKEIVLGYLPIAYETRLLLLSVNPPAKEDLYKVLRENKISELELDWQKIWQDLAN